MFHFIELFQKNSKEHNENISMRGESFERKRN